MAKTTDSTKVVVIDDELHNMQWMLDYAEAKGFSVITAEDVNAAIEILEKEIYRAIIIDLNIPVHSPIDAAILALGETYAKYPGLFVARQARNKGYRDRQVVIYTVHKDSAVAEEADRLMCTYILKGRPKEIKEEFERIVSFDPTSDFVI